MNFSVFLAIFLMSFHAQAQISADYWQGGAIRIGPSVSSCDSGTEGAVRYSSSGKILQFCDSSAWRNVGATAPSSDQTPDFFTFPNLTGQPVNTMIFSATVTVTGIDPDQTVNVTGAGAPQLRVNNGAWVGTASISAGDTLQIRLNSAASADTARQAVITLGTYTTNWTVTTRPGATIAFITSTTYTADFGGLAAADSICQEPRQCRLPARPV